MSEVKNKRDIILAAIKAGGATRESLMEVSNTDRKGLASQLSALNTRGHTIAELDPAKAEFPICKDGIFFMGSLADYNEKNAPSASGVKKQKTMEQVREDAQKREDKASSAHDRAAKKATDNAGDDVYELIAEIRKLELQLASLKLSKVEAGIYDYEGVVIVESTDDTAEIEATEDLLGV